MRIAQFGLRPSAGSWSQRRGSGRQGGSHPDRCALRSLRLGLGNVEAESLVQGLRAGDHGEIWIGPLFDGGAQLAPEGARFLKVPMRPGIEGAPVGEDVVL